MCWGLPEVDGPKVMAAKGLDHVELREHVEMEQEPLRMVKAWEVNFFWLSYTYCHFAATNQK